MNRSLSNIIYELLINKYQCNLLEKLLKITMQFSKENNLSTSIRSVKRDKLLIGSDYINYSCVLNSEKILGEWKGENVDKTSISDISFILEEQPDVIIFGTGEKSVAPNRNLVFDLAKKNIGIEAMTTTAASKTYNILISEGRDPVAILLIE